MSVKVPDLDFTSSWIFDLDIEVSDFFTLEGSQDSSFF